MQLPSAYLAQVQLPSAVTYLFMTQLAADFAVKGLLNLIMSSPVATGLAH